MTVVRDPVCGMQVPEEHCRVRRVYRGRNLGFCCSGCADAFDDDPERFTGGDTDSGEAPWLPERDH